jgi:hypothetical protein
LFGDLDGADRYLKEYLFNDINDKLGARHKQLLVSLEGDEGLQADDVEWLLKAKFGEDQMEDTIYALWNYTRALHAFVKIGDCKKFNKLLIHTIAKNSHVPPLILAWELPKEGTVFMEIGADTEAGDYAMDNTKYKVLVEC